MKKIIIAILVILVFVGYLPKHVNAEEHNVSTTSHEKSFSFNLTLKYQEYSFINEDGLLTKVSVRGAAGERTISYSNNKIHASFKVFISNNVITSAYDKKCSSGWWTITSDVLTRNSNYQATYTLSLKRLFVSTTRYLIANLSNGNLNVTFN